MSRKNKCGHKAGPNCVICNEPADLELTRHLALVYKLMDLAPYISQLGHLDTSGYAASSMFIDALGIPQGPAPDPGTVNRLCKLVVCAARTTGEMFRLAQPYDGDYMFETLPEWTPTQVLAARMAVAAANSDTLMVAELLVAAISGKEAMDQLELLTEVLFHNVMAAAKARQMAEHRMRAAR